MVFFSSELCTWDPIPCTFKLTHTCMHLYQGRLDCGFAVFLTRAWCDSWYWIIYHMCGPPFHAYLSLWFKLCLWFWLSWFIIHRSTCCVHDWFGNKPLLNRTPCAHTDAARWCYEWCLMHAWYVLHLHACFSIDIVQHMGHRDFECSHVTATRKTDTVMRRSLKQFTKASGCGNYFQNWISVVEKNKNR
jgi:hypothetical protein